MGFIYQNTSKVTFPSVAALKLKYSGARMYSGPRYAWSYSESVKQRTDNKKSVWYGHIQITDNKLGNYELQNVKINHLFTCKKTQFHQS